MIGKFLKTISCEFKALALNQEKVKKQIYFGMIDKMEGNLTK
jgi:hypothetical protein